MNVCLMSKVDKYGRGSAAANGEGFVDLAPGDTFAALEINQDAKSRSTPRGAISEDLNSAPFQDLTSQLADMISYYVGDVNRTHPKFVGRDEMFSTERAVKLLDGIERDFCAKLQAPGTKHQTPKFSIIIPVYNVAPYLRECLDSVLAQTFTDWEAICVDDGSTDGSGAILDEYREKVEKLGGGGQRTGKFVVIHQKNAGVSAARNAALDVACGEWFLFLDGDDLFRPDALEHIYQVVMENPCEGVLFQPYVEHLEREDVVPTDRFVVIAKMRNGAHLMTDEISANGFPFGRVYRRVIFGWLRFPEGVGMAEDVYFWSDAIGVDADWVAVKGSYYFYRQRDESACRRCDFAHYSQIVDVNLHVAKRLMQYEGASAVRAYWSRYHWSCEQVKDAFFSWRNYTESQKKRILQYKKDMEGLVADIPFSRDFKVRYFLYENHLSVLKGPIVQVLRCARGVKRRLERICKGRVK